MNDIVNPAGAQAIITVNYGSNPGNTDGGDTNVAAAWVNYANNTKHWGVKYWKSAMKWVATGIMRVRMGIRPALPGNQRRHPHWPTGALSAAYGSNAVQFIQAMKNQDPTILCGIGFSPAIILIHSIVASVRHQRGLVIIHWYPAVTPLPRSPHRLRFLQPSTAL